MAERVPAGTTTNPGQPLVVIGSPAGEYERVPNGRPPDTTAAITVVGAPVSE
jgi:hypothetical protein